MPRAFSQQSITPRPQHKRPLKKVITRRLSYYKRLNEKQQEIDDPPVHVQTNPMCFNACYSPQNMQYPKRMNGPRSRSPLQYLGCVPDNMPLSEGNMKEQRMTNFTSYDMMLNKHYKHFKQPVRSAKKK